MEQMKIGSISPEICPIGKFYREKALSLSLPTIQREFVWGLGCLRKCSPGANPPA